MYKCYIFLNIFFSFINSLFDINTYHDKVLLKSFRLTDRVKLICFKNIFLIKNID